MLAGWASRGLARHWEMEFFSDDEYKIIPSCQKRPTYVDSLPSVLVRRRLISPASRRPNLPMASTVIYYSTWKGEPFRRIEIFRESLGRERGRRFRFPESCEERVASEYTRSPSPQGPPRPLKRIIVVFLSLRPSNSRKCIENRIVSKMIMPRHFISFYV